jgi:ribosomal subunit interface protein
MILGTNLGSIDSILGAAYESLTVANGCGDSGPLRRLSQFQKSDVRRMELTINGKQPDVCAAFQGYIEDQPLTIAGEYFTNLTDGHVTMSKDGSDIRADVTVHVGKGIMLQGHAFVGDAYAAFDETAEHVGKRLRRYKRRLRNHHKSRSENTDTLPELHYVFAAEEEDTTNDPDQPVIAAEMVTEIKVMTPGDAVMWMDLANLPALMFHNVAHGGLNMVYRRADVNIGWVDPCGSRDGVPEGS